MEGQEVQKYAGQAFCDDGLFLAENNHELQVLCDQVSAFCELYQVKTRARAATQWTVERTGTKKQDRIRGQGRYGGGSTRQQEGLARGRRM